LKNAGLQPLPLALIDTQACVPNNRNTIENADWLIFTSPNAVVNARQLISPTARYQIAAVGRATAKALYDLGFTKVTIPESEYSSEGLLALENFSAVKNLRIAIIKGQGGRELLKQQLQSAGAQTSEVCVYKRVTLTPSIEEITTAIEQATFAIITSQEILQRLFEVTPYELQAKLLTLQLVVPSARVVQMAHSLGFTQVRQISSPLTESAMVAAVLDAHTTAISSGHTDA
jgi:uroporphyrinogen-III synthase